MSDLPKITRGTKRNNRKKRPIRRTRQQMSPVSPDAVPTGLGIPIPVKAAVDIFAGTEFTAPEDATIKLSREEREIIAQRTRDRIRQLPTLNIESVQYNLFSHEELKKMAAFKVTKEGKEGLRTVNDPRGGVVDNDTACSLCEGDNLTCPGHLGIIEFYKPIIHPLFLRETIYVLMSVCNSCGGLLCPRETLEEKGILAMPPGTKRLQAIAAASEKCQCRQQPPTEGEMVGVTGCIPNPYYRISSVKDLQNIFYSYESKKGGPNDNIRTVEEIEKIFGAISTQDAEILGFTNESHPSRFIMKSLPVVPICARAPVVQDGQILPDDLTSMYIDIVSNNEKLNPARIDELKEDEREAAQNSLIFCVSQMIDNADGKYRQGKKKPFLDIKSRIQGKEAIIRNLIQGKRVNFSARTVLGPDPNLKFGQIRIPRVMAPYLTYPEKVDPSNIGRLTRLLRAGRITHITSAHSGKRLPVSEKRKKEATLRNGDKVDRWLQDGDYVVFNRQPTLHKQGIMGYEVVLGDPLTIGLHLSYTPPHNADFDGDEGAIHAPQSEDAMLEVALLMCVKNNIMNAQNNKNIIGVVYDALTGAYLMTQKETMIDSGDFQNITSFLENTSGRDTLFQRLDEASVPRYSGRALFSSTLPEDFYYRKNDVLIKNGILLSGVIGKDHIGSAHGSIIQVMMKDYDQETTVNFLTDIYNVMREWLNVRGFSVGLDDCFLEQKVTPYDKYIDERIEGLKKLPDYREKSEEEINNVAEQLKKGEWLRDWENVSPENKKVYEIRAQAASPEMTIQREIQRVKMLVRSMGWKLEDPLEEERRERQVLAYLRGIKGFGRKISEEHMGSGNAFNIMAMSGAKGSTFNIAQITGILGQQFVQGQRMPLTLSGGRRASPYYPENTLDPASRGFVTNSFLTGLDPAEMFFHQAGGREGLTDTAIKTAETGHLHHKVVKALEDVKVYNDGSARNAFGVVFQYTYGEDGFNAGMVETVSTKTGKFASFINTKRLAARMNSKYGYKTPGEPDPDTFNVPRYPLGTNIKEGTITRVQGQRILVQPEKGEAVWINTDKGKQEEL